MMLCSYSSPFLEEPSKMYILYDGGYYRGPYSLRITSTALKREECDYAPVEYSDIITPLLPQAFVL